PGRRRGIGGRAGAAGGLAGRRRRTHARAEGVVMSARRVSCGAGRLRMLCVLLLAGVVLLAGCGLQSGSAVPLRVGPGSIRPVPALEGVPVTVGSKDFTEQQILGYIIEFALVAAGAEVRDLTNIQGSNSLRDAQLSGQID